jgi:LPXTG-site transpeptidase (sortase) family protein
VASERRPLPNQALDLLQTLLETPLSDAQPAPTHTTDRVITSAAAADALQALLNTLPAHADERRPPVGLRTPETLRRSRPARHAGSTWFDTLLQRSSQALMLGALVVLGYWFVNVPLNNWLHPRPVLVARALSVRPSVTAPQVATTKTTSLLTNAAAAARQTALPNDRAIPLSRASASPITASATLSIPTLHATELITVGEPLQLPVLAVEATPTDIPPPTAAPHILSPTKMLMWPTITPVQLGTVSKPSPAPVQRPIVVAQPAAPAQPHSASALPTRLIIPMLGLDVPIKEVFIVDDQWQVAEYAAGYLNGSGLPGVPGNLAMSGHAGLYGAVFASLGALNPGDDIYVDAAGVRYHYILRTASAVWPNQTEVLDSTETPTMTLITCTNWDTQRLVAQADFVDAGPVPNV